MTRVKSGEVLVLSLLPMKANQERLQGATRSAYRECVILPTENDVLAPLQCD